MKTIYLPPNDKYADGIRIGYDSLQLEFYGQFDGSFHLSGGNLTLSEFFDKLGITEENCRDAFVELAISKN